MTSAEAVYLLEVKWVLPLLVLAGCWNDAPGLHLEVRVGGTGAERVELYLATRQCTTCEEGLKPQGVGEKLLGPVWFLDGDTQVKTPNTSVTVSGGKAVFDLLPPGVKDVDIAFIVAVGYGADDKVVGVAKLSGVTIPHGKAKFWKVGLDDALDHASSDEKLPTGNRVWVWRRDGAQSAELAACVGLEVSDGAKLTRTWFVPEDDTDCDGLASECDFYNYKAAGTAELKDADCVKVNMTDPALPPDTCLVGGPACVDGAGDVPCGTVLPYYCAPSSMCANMSCRDNLPGCVIAGGLSYVKIEMPSDTANAPCPTDPAQTAVTVDLSMFTPRPAQNPTLCKSVKFAAKLEVGSIALTTEFTPNGSLFEIGSVAPPCKFVFTWVSGSPSDASNFTFMDLELDNGTHELVPLRLELIPGNCEPGNTARANAFLAPLEKMTNCSLMPRPHP